MFDKAYIDAIYLFFMSFTAIILLLYLEAIFVHHVKRKFCKFNLFWIKEKVNKHYLINLFVASFFIFFIYSYMQVSFLTYFYSYLFLGSYAMGNLLSFHYPLLKRTSIFLTMLAFVLFPLIFLTNDLYFAFFLLVYLFFSFYLGVFVKELADYVHRERNEIEKIITGGLLIVASVVFLSFLLLSAAEIFHTYSLTMAIR